VVESVDEAEPVEPIEEVVTGCAESPQNLVAFGVDNAIELTWDEPAASGFVATRYQARVTPGDMVVDISAPATQATIGGLLNGKAYEVSLVAMNEVGASEIAGPVLATPTNGLDGVVGRLVVQYEDGVAATEAPGVATGSGSVSGIELVPEVDLGDGMHTIELSEAAGVVYKYFLVYWGEHVFPCVREKLPEICKFQE
jgi:hypothetical protein